MAVFEDGKQDSSNNPQSGSASFKNGNNAGRYAQLLNENRQVIYVSLTSKGKFYEIEDGKSNHGSLQRSQSLDPNANNKSIGAKPKQEFAECVHRITNIVPVDSELPITVRFIAGQQGCVNAIPESITIAKVSIENCIIACPIEEPEARSPLHLRKLIVSPEMRLIKCFLGFENEVKMFSNQNVQNILKYCQFNCDNFTKMVDVEHIAIVKHATVNGTKHKVEGLKILRPLNFPKLLRREKSMIAHEKEDSIIFLSKNDLENMESKDTANDQSTSVINEKMKVFQSTKKKWFRNAKSSAKDNTNLETDLQNKRMSLDRYQDMSKLLQERFGGDVKIDGKNEIRANSEIGVDPRRATIDSSELRHKSISMQDVDSRSEYSTKPDLVNIDFVPQCPSTQDNSANTSEIIDNCQASDEEATMVSFTNQKSFITEKLCSEFHVKTKNHSKSSSNLQHLLHFSVPQKMNVHETKKIPTDSHHSDKAIKSIDFASMVSTTCIDDDLPYSSVRDSLVYQPHVEDDALTMNNNDANPSNSENIYAEICGESRMSVNSSVSRNSTYLNGGRSTIRISVGLSANSFEAGPSSSRHLSIDSSSHSDNIYNTLK